MHRVYRIQSENTFQFDSFTSFSDAVCEPSVCECVNEAKSWMRGKQRLTAFGAVNVIQYIASPLVLHVCRLLL